MSNRPLTENLQFEAVGICHRCTRRTSAFKCTAFPNGIPTVILTGEFIHTFPYPGDDGKLFDPIFS